jgi:excisionase family DNA binding protein
MSKAVDNLVPNNYHSVGSEDFERLMTVQEVADLLNTPTSYVYNMTSKSKIPHIKINGILRFRRSVIFDWLKLKEVTECQSTRGNSEI